MTGWERFKSEIAISFAIYGVIAWAACILISFYAMNDWEADGLVRFAMRWLLMAPICLALFDAIIAVRANRGARK